jgi:hypothetical protein
MQAARTPPTNKAKIIAPQKIGDVLVEPSVNATRSNTKKKK